MRFHRHRLIVIVLGFILLLATACSVPQTAQYTHKAEADVTQADQLSAWSAYQTQLNAYIHQSAWMVCIRTRESDRDDINHNGLHDGGYQDRGGYFGAYQFLQGTWNSAAGVAGEPWLIGQNPATVSVQDQDFVVWVYSHATNGSPWAGDFPYCGRP